MIQGYGKSRVGQDKGAQSARRRGTVAVWNVVSGMPQQDGLLCRLGELLRDKPGIVPGDKHRVLAATLTIFFTPPSHGEGGPGE